MKSYAYVVVWAFASVEEAVVPLQELYVEVDV
jgi:hypothetical protein